MMSKSDNTKTKKKGDKVRKPLSFVDEATGNMELNDALLKMRETALEELAVELAGQAKENEKAEVEAELGTEVVMCDEEEGEPESGNAELVELAEESGHVSSL